jgi:threonine/homoserine/homoserine lactone efflux protein
MCKKISCTCLFARGCFEVMEGSPFAGPAGAAAAGFGLGIALAGAPGPVQAVLLTESVRGGLPRGFRAMAGANLTFAALLLALALGISLVVPAPPVLRALRLLGGAFLTWLAIDGWRSAEAARTDVPARAGAPVAVRGALAVLLNPGAWLFLATAASSLFSAATQVGGRPAAVVAALTLVAGLALGDGSLVLFGGLGLSRAGSSVRLWIRRGLAVLLGAIGVAALISGLVG